MPAGTQSVGTLIIDLRANVAQLQADMNDVKETLQKSSREMSSQMKRDMQETRQVLALLRDDFGIGLPRELRKVVAESQLARTAILGIKDALFGIAFFNVALEIFNKISEYLAQSREQAQKEAEATRQIAESAQKAVEATKERQFQLSLIGKGEEERAALQKKFFEEEITRNRARLTALQGEIAAKAALLQIELAQAEVPSTDPFQVVGDEAEVQKEHDERIRQNAEILKNLANSMKPQIEAAQKAIDDATKGLKESEFQLADFERNLGLTRLKNEEQIALKDVELRQDTVQKMYQASRIGLDQELIDLRAAATQKHNLEIERLNDSLRLLEQDPGRNKDKIEQIHADIILSEKNYQKSLTDIYYHGVLERKKLAEEEARMEADVQRLLLESNRTAAFPGNLATGLSNGAPQLKADLIGAAVERFRGTFKDAAAQGKVLEQAMADLLTPMDKFRIEQEEINLLMAKPEFRNSPQVIKALQAELLKANPEFQKLMQASAEFGKDLSDELEQLILHGKSFSDVLKQLALDIAEIALKATLLKPLEDFFSGGKSGTGGIFSFLGSLFGGFHASGGTAPANQISVVGEQGPELFVPSTSGTIIPNGSSSGVTQIFNIDARGAAPGSEQNIIRGIQKAMEQTRKQAIAGMLDYQRRR